MNAISVRNLDVAYEDKYIIKNMNLEIPKGKITMIIGSNGCGKVNAFKKVLLVSLRLKKEKLN